MFSINQAKEKKEASESSKGDGKAGFVHQKDQGVGELAQWRRVLTSQARGPDVKLSEPGNKPAAVASIPLSPMLWGSNQGDHRGLMTATLAVSSGKDSVSRERRK